MKMKKIIGAAAALVIGLTSLSSVAFADSEEKKEIPFTYDKSMISTEENTPSLSFDGDDWTKYVHTTSDASKIGLKVSIDKDTYYQGFSLKATASGSQNSELFMHAGLVRDADNNPVYPGAEEEGAQFISPGFELRCEDFGLSCFDGCFLTFMYKMGADAQGKLMGDSVYVYADDGDLSKNTSSAVALKYDALMNNNVTQYRAGSISVPYSSASTRIVFETPVLEAMESDIFCIDNITITLPTQEDGSTIYIKSLDGYNKSAVPQETIEALQVGEKKASTPEIGSAPEKQEGGNGFVVVIIIIVVVLAGGVGGFFFIKKKKKFY